MPHVEDLFLNADEEQIEIFGSVLGIYEYFQGINKKILFDKNLNLN